jgi:hypothetical protein
LFVSVRGTIRLEDTSYLVAFDVLEAVTITEIFCNSALSASCRTGDNKDVVTVGDSHLGCFA